MKRIYVDLYTARLFPDLYLNTWVSVGRRRRR